MTEVSIEHFTINTNNIANATDIAVKVLNTNIKAIADEHNQPNHIVNVVTGMISVTSITWLTLLKLLVLALRACKKKQSFLYTSTHSWSDQEDTHAHTDTTDEPGTTVFTMHETLETDTVKF